MGEVRIELYGHQLDLMTAKESRLCCLGGVGSGKSYVMMLKMTEHLLKFPGTTGLLVARVKEDLRKKNWNDYLDGFRSYVRHEDRQGLVLTLLNGSRIYFVHGWDDERGVDHLDGYNCSVFLMSQAEDCPEKTYRKLVDRNRKKNKGETEWLELLEGNPRGKDWIYRLFCQGADSEGKSEDVKGKQVGYRVWTKEGSRLVQVESANYDFVPDGYLENLLANSSDRYKSRYVEGKFDAYTGLVYDCWNDKIHLVEPRAVPKELDKERYARVLAFDWGRRVPSAALWAVYDRKEDEYLLYREHYKSGLSAEGQAREILKLSGGEKVDICIADTQIFAEDPIVGTTIALEFQKIWPWPVVPADKRIERGVEQVYKYLSSGKMKAFSDMKNFRAEIEEYKYEDDDEVKEPKRNLKERPLKKKDHMMDCLRYLVASRVFYEKPVRPSEKSVEYMDETGRKRILRTNLE